MVGHQVKRRIATLFPQLQHQLQIEIEVSARAGTVPATKPRHATYKFNTTRCYLHWASAHSCRKPRGTPLGGVRYRTLSAAVAVTATAAAAATARPRGRTRSADQTAATSTVSLNWTPSTAGRLNGSWESSWRRLEVVQDDFMKPLGVGYAVEDLITHLLQRDSSKPGSRLFRLQEIDYVAYLKGMR